MVSQKEKPWVLKIIDIFRTARPFSRVLIKTSSINLANFLWHEPAEVSCSWKPDYITYELYHILLRYTTIFYIVLNISLSNNKLI